MREEKEVVEKLSDEFRRGFMGRRDFIQKVIVSAGGVVAAGHALRKLGFGDELLREAHAQETDITTENVEYPSQGEMIQAYLARPEGGGPFPTMIVIHEIYGLSEFARDVARLFARSGYLAMAPNVLPTTGASLPDGRHAEWMMQTLRTGVADVPPDEIQSLRDGHTYLTARADVDATHIGSVGFCWGGARSFTLATVDPDLWAAVVFYGSSPPFADLDNIQAPVLGLYGALDNSGPTSITGRAAETAREMQMRSKTFEWEIYSSAPHGFFREGAGTNPDAHVAETREALVARDLMFDFLDRHY